MILQWVTMPSSRGSSQPREKPRSSALQADSSPLSHQGGPSLSFGWLFKFKLTTAKKKLKIQFPSCTRHMLSPQHVDNSLHTQNISIITESSIKHLWSRNTIIANDLRLLSKFSSVWPQSMTFLNFYQTPSACFSHN